MRFTAFAAAPIFAAAALSLVAAPAVAADQAPTAVTPAAATLTITFTGIEQAKGRVMLSLYDAEGAWAGGKPVRVAMVDVAGTEAVVTFAGLAPGQYAVKSFHDIDGDGKLATNPFGLPTEPFAFSNDAHGDRGPASWAAAAFTVAAGANQQRITLR